MTSHHRRVTLITPQVDFVNRSEGNSIQTFYIILYNNNYATMLFIYLLYNGTQGITMSSNIRAAPIIGIGRLVRWYRPIVVYTIGKYKCLFYYQKQTNLRVASISGKSGCVL